MTLEQLGNRRRRGARRRAGRSCSTTTHCRPRCMEALEEHGVLVFRGLHIDDETQVAFSKRLDDVGKAEPAEPPRDLHRHARPGQEPRPPTTCVGPFDWHIDGAQDEVPTKATMLSAHVVAPAGGETEFASTYAAYDDLSDDEKERVRRAARPPFVRGVAASGAPRPHPRGAGALAREARPGAPARLAAPVGAALPGHRRHRGPRRRDGPRRGQGAARRPARRVRRRPSASTATSGRWVTW